MSTLQTEYPLWYLLPCLALGVLYAWILYKKDAPWSKAVNRSLAVVRAVLAALVALLLLGPYARLLERSTEPPIVAVAIDNSQSMALVNSPERLQASLQTLSATGKALQEAGIEVAFHTLGTPSVSPDSLMALSFTEGSTDLNGLLQNLQNSYENRHLSGIVLLSDGIYNTGASPSYFPHQVPVFTLGIGDTVPQRDINLRTLYANKIAYLGNRFPLVAEIQQTGFPGREVIVSLTHKGVAVAQQRVTLAADQPLTKVEFLGNATEEGMQRYEVGIQPLEGEFTTKNNRQSAYIDILDSREKILLVAPTPHPDLKALRSAIAQQENYQLDVYIPALANSPQQKKINLDDKYDLVIFHQVPNRKRIAENLPKKFMEQGTATLFILGKESLLPAFNQLQTGANIRARTLQQDFVTPIFSSRFGRFTFKSDHIATLTQFPPVAVPFGDYQLTADMEPVLFQRVGNIATEKPLLAVRTGDGPKSAVIFGEGLWQWRLQEFALEQDQNAFDELITKLVQYLSSKEDKRRFRVYPTNNEFMNTDEAVFETEVYNDIYEQTYGQQIALRIIDEQGKEQSYAYANIGPNFRYSVRGLRKGVYRYVATTTLDGAVVSSEGQFSMREQALEALNTTADFGMLRELARQTGGRFYTADVQTSLQEQLIANKAPDIIHTQEATRSLMHAWWPLLLLLVLATIEWATRKVKGGY